MATLSRRCSSSSEAYDYMWRNMGAQLRSHSEELRPLMSQSFASTAPTSPNPSYRSFRDRYGGYETPVSPNASFAAPTIQNVPLRCSEDKLITPTLGPTALAPASHLLQVPSLTTTLAAPVANPLLPAASFSRTACEVVGKPSVAMSTSNAVSRACSFAPPVMHGPIQNANGASLTLPAAVAPPIPTAVSPVHSFAPPMQTVQNNTIQRPRSSSPIAFGRGVGMQRASSVRSFVGNPQVPMHPSLGPIAQVQTRDCNNPYRNMGTLAAEPYPGTIGAHSAEGLPYSNSYSPPISVPQRHTPLSPPRVRPPSRYDASGNPGRSYPGRQDCYQDTGISARYGNERYRSDLDDLLYGDSSSRMAWPIPAVMEHAVPYGDSPSRVVRPTSPEREHALRHRDSFSRMARSMSPERRHIVPYGNTFSRMARSSSPAKDARTMFDDTMFDDARIRQRAMMFDDAMLDDARIRERGGLPARCVHNYELYGDTGRGFDFAGFDERSARIRPSFLEHSAPRVRPREELRDYHGSFVSPSMRRSHMSPEMGVLESQFDGYPRYDGFSYNQRPPIAAYEDFFPNRLGRRTADYSRRDTISASPVVDRMFKDDPFRVGFMDSRY